MGNFSAFLKYLRAKYQFAAAKDLFAHLGGEAKLGMSLRNFQLLESGQQSPTPKAFDAIFSQLEREDYKRALSSFLESHSDEDSVLLTYLREHLTEAFNKTEKSVWETKKKQMTYSESQMAFLSQNPEAMRIHHKTLLFEKIALSEITEKQEVVDALVAHELAIIEGKFLKCFRTLIRTPNYENAAPSTVRKANQMLLSNIETYVSLEGGENQEMSYALQLVNERTAAIILEEMKKFKKWVQSMAADGLGDDLKPFVMVNFGKQLKARELS